MNQRPYMANGGTLGQWTLGYEHKVGLSEKDSTDCYILGYSTYAWKADFVLLWGTTFYD